MKDSIAIDLTVVPNALLGSVTTENSGQVGDAADFNSAKVEVSGLSLSSDAGAQTTISMWVQADPSGSWEMLAASDRYDMVLDGGNIGFNTAAGDLFGSDASELADGQWHHVVGIFTNGDATQNTIFIDGVSQEMSQIKGTPSSSSANIGSSGGSLFFGSWGASNDYTFTGSMDEVKVYNGALSSDDVTALHSLESTNVKWDGGVLSTLEDNALIINPAELLINDTDPDGDTLSISAVQSGEHGTVSMDGDGNIVFTPDENYHGEATFSYTVSDGKGGEDSATVTLNVSSVNDLPTIDVINSITVDEDGSQQFTYSVSDIDSSNVTLTGSAENGTVVVNNNGTVTFTPDENYFGGDTIVLSATDSNGGVTTHDISVTVNPIEDAPDAVDDGNFEPQSAILTAEINFDGSVPNALLGSVTTENSGQVGAAADFNSAKVEVSGLDLNGAAGAQTTVSMWVQANPSGGWEMLAASDRYDMVLSDGNIGFNTARGDLFGSDASELADGEWHHIVGVFTNGDVTQNSIFIDGVAQEMSQIQGTPSSSSANIDSSGGSLFFGSWGASNSYTFTGSMDEVKVYNGALSSDDVTALHSLESANIKWSETALSTDEDVSLVLDPSQLLANDIDVDGDTLSIASVQDAQNGTVAIDGDGNIVFTPDANYNGEATFTYTIDDGNGNTDTATATLNVNSVNDAPVVADIDLGSTREDAAITFSSTDLLANSSDADGDALAVSAVSVEAQYGSITDNGDGTWTFNPAEDYSGDDVPIQFSVSDGNTINSATVSIDVTPVNEINGTAGNDTLRGTNLDDHISGYDGNDRITGGAGNDTLDGGAGNDVIDARGGTDSVDGGTGDDYIYADGSDAIDGGEGFDSVSYRRRQRR